MSHFFILFVGFLSVSNLSKAQNSNDIILKLLKKEPKKYQQIYTQPTTHQVEIIYTQIVRNEHNTPRFYTYHYNPNPTFYYCASQIKLPTSALALQKLNELGISKETIMLTDTGGDCQVRTHFDNQSSGGFPSIETYIKRMLLVSDNEAYGRVWEFVTPSYIHQKLAEKGYPEVRINIRFDASCLGEGNKITNPIRFLNHYGGLLYQQNQTFISDYPKPPFGSQFKCTSYNGRKTTKDFTYSNLITLRSIHSILQSIIFPDFVPNYQKFNLTQEDYRFLQKNLGSFPRESSYPFYDTIDYFDAYKKYLFLAQKKDTLCPSNVRIFNIPGQSHGYTSDCTYFVDFSTGVEFMLSVRYAIQRGGCIDANESTYKKEIMPFFENIGKTIYNFELQRQKTYFPDLSQFQNLFP